MALGRGQGFEPCRQAGEIGLAPGPISDAFRTRGSAVMAFDEGRVSVMTWKEDQAGVGILWG